MSASKCIDEEQQNIKIIQYSRVANIWLSKTPNSLFSNSYSESLSLLSQYSIENIYITGKKAL